MRVELAHDVFEPGEIGFGCAQLLFGILAADMQPGNAGRFLQHLAAFGGLGGDHRGDAALADQRRRMRAGGSVGEDQRDILGPDIAAIDPIGAARAALDAADDFQFLAIVVGGMQHHFGKVASRTLGSAGENHIFHAAAAQRFGAGFAHHPAYRFQEIALAAAIGPDDPGQPLLNAQLCRFNEALESGQLEPLDLHRLPQSPECRAAPQRAPMFWILLRISSQVIVPIDWPLTRKVGVPSILYFSESSVVRLASAAASAPLARQALA